MTGVQVGSLMFAIMLTLMIVRVPIGIAMFLVGCGGYAHLTDGNFYALLSSL